MCGKPKPTDALGVPSHRGVGIASSPSASSNYVNDNTCNVHFALQAKEEFKLWHITSEYAQLNGECTPHKLLIENRRRKKFGAS